MISSDELGRDKSAFFPSRTEIKLVWWRWYFSLFFFSCEINEKYIFSCSRQISTHFSQQEEHSTLHGSVECQNWIWNISNIFPDKLIKHQQKQEFVARWEMSELILKIFWNRRDRDPHQRTRSHPPSWPRAVHGSWAVLKFSNRDFGVLQNFLCWSLLRCRRRGNQSINSRRVIWVNKLSTTSTLDLESNGY